jgi:hypothetical protein
VVHEKRGIGNVVAIDESDRLKAVLLEGSLPAHLLRVNDSVRQFVSLLI